jgi:predicted RNA-binding Zn-ribbon protein involved in translation (DUF1610 family)
MQEVFPEKDFDDVPITCPNCGWEGLGSETNIIDLYGLSKLKEVHCPSCDTYIAGLRRERAHGEQPDGDELSNQFG